MKDAERNARQNLALAEDRLEQRQRELLIATGWVYGMMGCVWYWRKLIKQEMVCMNTRDAIQYERFN